METNTTEEKRSFWSPSVRSPHARRGDRAVRRRALSAFVIVTLVGLILLQKFAVEVNLNGLGIPLAAGAVQATLPVFYLGLIAAGPFIGLKLDIRRVALFSVFMIAVTLSLALNKNIYSPSSVLLLVACYLPFLVYVEISAERFRKLIDYYVWAMVGVGVIVIFQHIVQLTSSHLAWPNLNLLAPQELLLPGFNYLQPITEGSRIMKPNAVFFLEVSTVSQFLALALVIETIFFVKIWRMVFLAGVLLACFAGTGLFMLAMSAPVVLLRVSPKTILAALIVFASTYVVAERIHWYQTVQGRFNEYEQQGSSADLRFVAPGAALVEALSDQDMILSGIGPGNSDKTTGYVTWASTKVVTEYGLIPGALFMLFIGYCLFAHTHSNRLSFAVLVLYNFMAGGIIIPIYPVILLLCCVMFRPPAGAKPPTWRRNGYEEIWSSLKRLGRRSPSSAA
jgi:hypothetical protein